MEWVSSLPSSQQLLLYPNPTKPSHALRSYFCKVHLNIIFPSRPVSFKWFLSFRFPYQNPLCIFFSPIRFTYPAHPILLDFFTWIICNDKYKSRSSLLCTFPQPPITFSLLEQNFLPYHIILEKPNTVVLNYSKVLRKS